MARPCIEPQCTELAYNGPRCNPHTRERDRQTRSKQARPHYAGNYTTRRNQLIRAWLTHIGPICPGYQRDPHHVPPTHPTADHIRPGDPTSPLRVLCRSCNSTRGNNTRDTNTGTP